MDVRNSDNRTGQGTAHQNQQTRSQDTEDSGVCLQTKTRAHSPLQHATHAHKTDKETDY